MQNERRCIPIKSDLDIISARVEARELAKQLGFGIIDQARISTAVSEMARNIVLYTPQGTVTIRIVTNNGGQQGIEVICEDEGEGIQDVELAMQDGYSTSKGLGKGLPGARRLVDEFEMESTPGKGTKVTMRKWLR
jgi:serine/threonine-protein kinase RsbT